MVGHRDEAAEQRTTGTGSGAVLYMARTAPVGRNVPLQRKSSARHGRALEMDVGRVTNYRVLRALHRSQILASSCAYLLVLCDCG
jgi:hypothetical protein